MKYIGFGDVNKKLLYILLGGIGKLIAELILYFYGKDVKMTNHCFIIGINASMGMLLAFIPDIIVKYKIRKSNDNIEDEKIIMYNDFFQENRSRFTKTQKKTFYTYFMLCFRLFSKNLDFFL